VVFYSRLAQEDERFSIDDVIEHVHAKLVRRHPHVFGETRARTPEEALESWNAVKRAERSATEQPGSSADVRKSVLDGIAPALPSTLEAYELGIRAAEAGFDWAKAEDLLDKIEEEVRELRRDLRHAPNDSREASGGNPLEEETGDLLFAVANLARFLRFDPESCLRRANQKFRRRFRALELVVQKRGKQLKDCTAAELDQLWNEVKAGE
jgi:nucleoside triphosphate diphosphatase